MPLFNPSGNPDRQRLTYLRTTNIPASTTITPNSDGASQTICIPRNGTLTRCMFDGSLGSVPVGSSPLLIKVSVNGGADITVASISNADGASAAKDIASPVAVNAGDRLNLRYVTDASWTGTTLDPQADIELTAN